jgi:ADP-dependent NAD(P)H-hydrate dehydratase / NAD(P)H-hydrate epimerase
VPARPDLPAELHGGAGRIVTGFTGIDLVEVERLRKALARHTNLEGRVFSPEEIEYCRSHADPVPSFAARFAGKEAVGKLLGIGVFSWREIEVLRGPHPRVRLSGRTAEVARARGIAGISVSLSHVDSVAGASIAPCLMAVARPQGGSSVDDMSRDQGANPNGVSGRDGMPGGACEPGDAGYGQFNLPEPLALHALEERPAVFTPAQMREMDRATIEDIGIPGPVLMERAALGVTSLILQAYTGRHTLVVCGRGNNGGDGLAVARQLHLARHPVACIVAASSAEHLSADAALNLKAAEGVGVNLRMGTVPDYLWDETEVVVDCLLGTGSEGEIRGQLAEWARRINDLGAQGVPVVAVDVPSGVDARTGSIARDTVAADVTVTFHAAKSGLVCPPGSEAAGEVFVWDIGIARTLEPEPDLRVVTAEDVLIPGRRVDDHKYRAGFVAVVAGSKAYPGAALLAARGAERAGAGYVRLVTPAGAAEELRPRLTEIVVQEAGAGDRFDDVEAILAGAGDERIGALVVGPGVGREPETAAAVRAVVLRTRAPAVLDADGLLAFSGDPAALRARPGLVLTPHVGELAHLLGAETVQLAASSLVAARRAAAETGQVVLLKGSSTVIVAPSGETRAVVQAPPQLASAGTGDVLSGVIGAFLAKGMDPFEAACAGAWVHAEAGLIGATTDPQGVLAGDLADLLPDVIAEQLYERRPGWRD